MASREVPPAGNITVAPVNIDRDLRQNSRDSAASFDSKKQQKKNSGKAFINFLYNPRNRTVLGRSSLNWAKLAAFYAVFYFFLGCFFVALVWVFASMLHREKPRYYNTESVMAVRSTSAVVGMGFRPQPLIDSSLIEISNNLFRQERIASSLRLFRDVYLLQNADAETEQCSQGAPASKLPSGTACAFSWFDIVKGDDHPCSDNNLYGFKHEQPCILLKVNKVYGWTPGVGASPLHTSRFRTPYSSKNASNSDVFVTCNGTNIADNDVVTNVTYYSLPHPDGSSKYGVVPNHFFPYRNARDHVQPFVLVQFNKLPLYRLVTVTCRAWAPGIEHSVKGMRGMVSFQLYRTHTHDKSDHRVENQ